MDFTKQEIKEIEKHFDAVRATASVRFEQALALAMRIKESGPPAKIEEQMGIILVDYANAHKMATQIAEKCKNELD
jgi:hypothetical protein